MKPEEFKRIMEDFTAPREIDKWDNCLDSGGHYWLDAESGERYECKECGFLGATNLPTVDECAPRDV